MSFGLVVFLTPLHIWLFHTLLNWGIISVVIYLAIYFHNPLVYLLAIFIIGTRQHALTILGHEGSHFLISKRVWINEILASTLSFWPFGISLQGYRYFHLTHHSFLGTSHDPEQLHKAGSKQWKYPKRTLFYIIKDLCGLSFMEVYRLAKFTAPRQKSKLILPVTYMLLCNLLIYLEFSAIPIILWYISLYTSFWCVFRLRVWTEHIGTPTTLRVHLQLWQRLIYAPCNIWYHWEHHNCPSIPFYNLPQYRKSCQ